MIDIVKACNNFYHGLWTQHNNAGGSYSVYYSASFVILSTIGLHIN